MSPLARRSHRRHLALAALLACSFALAGCGEDNGTALTPVTQAVRAQPGIADVDDFYSPPQLKVAEGYEAVAHLGWSAGPERACATIRTFVEATAESGVDPRTMRLSLRHADDGETYPLPWSFTMSISHGTTRELVKECLVAHRLRSLPAGSTAMTDTRHDRIDMRIEVPRSAADSVAEAEALVGKVLRIRPSDLDDWEETGYHVRVSLRDVSESPTP